VFTDRVRLLDSVSLYHRLERGSRRWAEENGGAVLELHCYAVPDEVAGQAEVRAGLLEELFAYFPELRAARILHEHLQLRDDFTAFHVGLAADRPGCDSGIPGLHLAADWVRLPTPAMLMEAACTAALLAANGILEKEGLRAEPLYTVPLRGFLASRRQPASRRSGGGATAERS
jgi:isorenieratene synthase